MKPNYYGTDPSELLNLCKNSNCIVLGRPGTAVNPSMKDKENPFDSKKDTAL